MKHYAVIAASLLAMTGAVPAQEFPSGPVTLVVAYPPGGSVDILARHLSQELGALWGENVIVENRPGAGATLAAAYVSQAEPDGRTLLITTSAYTTAPAVYADLPFDPLEDLIPVAMPAFSQFLMVAGAGVESETLEEFLVEAREREMFLTTAGLGTSTHFAGELFSAAADIPMTTVHYTGFAQAMTDLMAGRADIYVGSLAAVIENVRSGQVKAIAIMGDERAPELPDVQTTAENGIEGAETGLWFGIFAPAGTPDAIVATLNADITEAMRTPGSAQFAQRQLATVLSLTPKEFKDAVAAEIEQWKVMAEELGIEPE